MTPVRNRPMQFETPTEIQDFRCFKMSFDHLTYLISLTRQSVRLCPNLSLVEEPQKFSDRPTSRSFWEPQMLCWKSWKRGVTQKCPTWWSLLVKFVETVSRFISIMIWETKNPPKFPRNHPVGMKNIKWTIQSGSWRTIFGEVCGLSIWF